MKIANDVEGALPPLEWNPPQPHQLPALRERLVDQMRNPFEHFAQQEMLKMGLGTIYPFPDNPSRSASALLADENRRLRSAHMYSITADMTVFAVQAGEKLPDWEVRPEDLPAPNGFMVFGEPIGAYVNNEQGRKATVSIVAVSWGPTVFADSAEATVWVTFWSITDFQNHIDTLRKVGGMSLDQARTETYRQRAELSWDNEVVLPLDGTHELDLVDRHVAQRLSPEEFRTTVIAQETTAPWMQSVRAAWLLMKQPKMTETVEEHLPKTQRRRAARLNMDTSPVRVIHLHRDRRRHHAPPAEGYTHTIQYPVSGHWRQQPYPSRDIVERIWIDEHIRGPEDAPFRVGKRYTVKVLDRPPR